MGCKKKKQSQAEKKEKKTRVERGRLFSSRRASLSFFVFCFVSFFFFSLGKTGWRGHRALTPLRCAVPLLRRSENREAAHLRLRRRRHRRCITRERPKHSTAPLLLLLLPLRRNNNNNNRSSRCSVASAWTRTPRGSSPHASVEVRSRKKGEWRRVFFFLSFSLDGVFFSLGRLFSFSSCFFLLSSLAQATRRINVNTS